MNKEDILRMSQQENKGRPDERELAAFGESSRVSMLIGAVICVGLILLGNCLTDMRELAYAGWIVYLAMQGSNNIVLFKHLKKRSNLIYGIIEILLSVAFIILHCLPVEFLP